MSRGKDSYIWAKDLINKLDKDGEWILDEQDYGFTVGLASEKRQRAFYLSHCGDNMGHRRFDVNEWDEKDRLNHIQKIISGLEWPEPNTAS